MLLKKSRIAWRPRISALSPPAGLSGARSVASLAHGTCDMSFAAMPSKYAFTLCRELSFITASSQSYWEVRIHQGTSVIEHNRLSRKKAMPHHVTAVTFCNVRTVTRLRIGVQPACTNVDLGSSSKQKDIVPADRERLGPILQKPQRRPPANYPT